MFKDEIKINFIPLSTIERNKFAVIASLPTGEIKSQLLRHGLSEGQKIRCISKLPGGTMIIKINNQEIALGMAITKKILIENNRY